MKIKKILPTLLISLLFASPSFADDSKSILVTIKPLHSLVSNVLGDTGKADLLITGADSPHDFNLKPSQVRNMYHADAIFYIDDDFETFLDRAFDSLPNQVKKVEVAEHADIKLLEYREGGAWDTHDDHHDDHGHDNHEDEHHDEHGHDDHDDEHHHDDEHGHDDHDDEHDDHMHGEHDLHVWLAPKNAKKIVSYIAKELSELYPENSATYEENAKATIKKLDELDHELHESLHDVEDEPFIVFHDAYQYFEKAYHLNGVGSITLDPEQAPSPNHLSEVREKIQQTKAKCVFREPQFSDRLVKTVTEGTNAKNGTLDPLGANLEPGATQYFLLMRNLATSLKNCLN